LDFASVRLEGAMYRIGYLEAQVNSQEEQLKVLPEFRARAAKAILTERENDMLKEENSSLKIDLTAAHKESADLHEEVTQLHSVITRLEQLWWWRILSWAFGFKLSETKA
ncbi:MAG: hypothetical protein ACRD3W_28795, partial [Terriglobales bacterium]